MKKLLCIFLVAALVLAVSAVAGAEEVTVSYTVDGNGGYEISIPASVNPTAEGATQTIALTANHTGKDITVTLASSAMGGTGSAASPFIMCRNGDILDFDLKYTITDKTNSRSVTAGTSWTFQSGGIGAQSFSLLYQLASDTAYLQSGTYTDKLTFSVG